MKKRLIIAVISAAFMLSACGNSQTGEGFSATAVCEESTAMTEAFTASVTEITASANTADYADEPLTVEEEIISARIAHINERYIYVKALTQNHITEVGKYICIYKNFADLNGFTGQIGDYIDVFVDSDCGVDDSEIPGVSCNSIVVTESSGITLGENETLAEVTECIKSKNGSYLLTVSAFTLKGYYMFTPIFIGSGSEYAVGDWLKISFADDTCFMESSPLQVSDEYVLNVEKV